jgi:hypothetical protein
VDSGTLAQLERIAAAGIQVIPIAALDRHFVFEREGVFILVENREGRFGGIGSPGLITEHGFAPLVERAGRMVFIHKGNEQQADPAQVERARELLTILKAALS